MKVQEEQLKEIVILAKEFGFKPKTFSTEELFFNIIDNKVKVIDFEHICIYLLLCEIQVWLIENYNIHVQIVPYNKKFLISILKKGQNEDFEELFGTYTFRLSSLSDSDFALATGILEAFKLIENENPLITTKSSVENTNPIIDTNPKIDTNPINEELLKACEWAKDMFKRLADEGKYPEFMLARNGGDGIMPLVNAINNAKNMNNIKLPNVGDYITQYSNNIITYSNNLSIRLYECDCVSLKTSTLQKVCKVELITFEQTKTVRYYIEHENSFLLFDRIYE